MRKRQFRRGQIFGNWTLHSYLGGGGNGEVWKCFTAEGKVGAIKLIKSMNHKSYNRFLDEITIIEKNSDIEGIIPMIDKYLPEEQKAGIPFFIMPVAEKSEILLKGKPIEEKIDAILQICTTLAQLHRRGISHRDLKPPNLLVYNSRFCIADFGLVDYPNKKDVSLKNEEIGAKWTMAPEMRRESSNADGLKADIYSLAKTLWIILTEIPKGFDGQYLPDSILDLKQFYKRSYTTPLDTLLSACTNNDPTARPNIDEFISALQDWKVLNEDFHQRNLEQWFEVQTRLFPATFPKRVIWENISDIIKVLKILCYYDDLNHMFFPDGGGLDLEDVRLSHEKDCIELDFQLIDIVKPRRLIFESFYHTHEWNYFRLELDDLKPSGVYEQNDRDHEEVSELYPGQYDKYDLVEYRHEYNNDGYEIPETARQVSRWFRGSFVIFSKRSPYNLISSTYDGRHNKMNTDEFRDYIQRSVDHFKKQESEKGFFDKLFGRASKSSKYSS